MNGIEIVQQFKTKKMTTKLTNKQTTYTATKESEALGLRLEGQATVTVTSCTRGAVELMKAIITSGASIIPSITESM